MDFYIYILYSKTIDKFYLGYSSDPWIRYVQHLNNSKEKYTGKAKDWEMKTVFKVSNSEAEAIRMERFIKKQKSRKLIEQLCELNLFQQDI